MNKRLDHLFPYIGYLVHMGMGCMDFEVGHVVQGGMLQMHFLRYRVDRYTLEYGLILHKMHLDHTFRGKDLHICFEDKLYFSDNQSSIRIRDDIRNMDHRDIRADMYRYHRCIEH